MDIYPIQHKHCKICNTTKSIDNFYKHKSSKDGFSPRCKECNKIRIKKEAKPDEFLKDYYQAKKDARAYENARARRYIKQRELEDPLYKVKRLVSGIIRDAFKRKNYIKNSYTHEI